MYQSLPFGAYGFEIALGVIAIMLSVSGISLGLGYALDDRRLKEFGKAEIQQSIINAALVGSLLLLFANNGLISVLITSLTGGAVSSFSCPAYMDANAALCFSYNYLVGLEGYSINGTSYDSLFSMISLLLIALLSLSTVLGIIAGFKINLLIISLSFSSILSPILSQIQYLLSILFGLALGITVQASILSFVALSAVTFILPLGLILRSFYMTRKLGGFLIAVALGTYVVLPLSYVLNAAMVSSYASTNSTEINQLTLQSGSIKDQIAGENLQYNQSNPGLFASLTSGISSIVQSANQALSDILLGLSKLIMEIFILPAFSLIITGISIRELSVIFGSEAAFGRFKMLQ